MRHAHIIGAGLAGLAAALDLADAGFRVVVHEAAPQAGGRCRSYHDAALGCRIDNGNHLLLSGNRAAFAYLDRIGARASLVGPGVPCFPFIDRGDGTRFVLRPNPGRLPWWVFSRARRVPGTRVVDYLALQRLNRAGPAAVVAEVLPPGNLYRRLLEPLAVAALNTPAAEGSARLLGAVVRESLARGGAACVPCFAREGLSESFVAPALARLAVQRAELRLNARVSALECGDARVAALVLGGERFPLERGDVAVLAVPPGQAAALLPGLVVPDAFQTILNVHYRLEADPGPVGFWGVIGGFAEWVFVRPGIVAVTVSAANDRAELEAAEIARRAWPDVCAAAGISAAMPAWRVVKERRASFAATPAQERRRPGTRTAWNNLALAGDWTATGLPATIEGAIRSGFAAAALLTGPV